MPDVFVDRSACSENGRRMVLKPKSAIWPIMSL